jgi:hypothetical protein
MLVEVVILVAYCSCHKELRTVEVFEVNKIQEGTGTGGGWLGLQNNWTEERTVFDE